MNELIGNAVSVNAQNIRIQRVGYLIGLVLVALPGYTIAQDVIDPNQNYEECYRGIIPEFSRDAMSGDITYYSYSIDDPEITSGEQNSDEDEITKESDEDRVKRMTRCASFVGTRKYRYDIERVSDKVRKKSPSIAIASKSNFAPTLAKPRSDGTLEFHKEGDPITSFKDTIVRPFLNFDPDNKKKLHPNLVLRTTIESGDRRSTRLPFVSRAWLENPPREWIIFKDYVTGDSADNSSTFSHHLIERPHATSNGCWLLVPESELRHDRHTKHNDPIKTFRYQNVRIYPLFNKDKEEEINEDKRCKVPQFTNNFLFDTKRALGMPLMKKEPDGKWTIPLTHFKLLDFHPTVLKSYEVRGTEIEPLDFEDFKNNKLFGIDYVARSEHPNELEVFYQAGTATGKRKVDDGIDGNVKQLKGSLNYVKFTINGEQIEATEHALISQQEGGKISCDGKDENDKPWSAQWISNLSLSRDRNRLYFLAGLKKGNESAPVGLFTIDIDNMKNGDAADINEMKECKRMDKYKNQDGKVKAIKFFEDYPLTGYSVSPNGSRLTAWFEKEGESVIRFYALNKDSDKILYQFPETIQGIGSVFDVAEDLSGSGAVAQKTFYVMHSHLDFPVSLSRCVLSDGLFSCSSRDSPLDTSNLGKKIIDPEFRHKNSVYWVKTKSGKMKGVNNRLGYIPYFVLEPETKSCKTIVSIHGGPHEAWNGTFSPREYGLAQLGYTVYLPNPTGSTGYGQKYTKDGEGRWGFKPPRGEELSEEELNFIGDDVRDFITKVHGLHKDRVNKLVAENQCQDNDEGFYLKGFSFGGYMMNWLLSTPVSKFDTKRHVDGVIAVNGIFDIEDFAATTDQAWFAQFQLGRSGSSAVGGLSQEIKKQNPAAQFDLLFGSRVENESDPIMPPILFIAGTYDQRVNFCGNVPKMLKFYRKNHIPYALQLEKYETHVFDNLKSWKQANLIHSWLNELKHCEDTTVRGKWNLACTSKEKMTGFSNRSVSQVFDNCLPYEFYQDCLKDVDKDEAGTLIPLSCGVSGTTMSSM